VALYVRQVVSDARAREKPCLRCGLSLRKHLDDRHCPHCGLSVWMSLNANDSLDYSNADWLRKASRGAWAMAAIQVVAFLAYLTLLFGVASSFFGTIKQAQSIMTGPARRGAPASQPATTTTTSAVAQNDLDEPDESDAFGAAWDAAARVPLGIATTLAGIYFVLEAGGLVLLTPHEQRYPDRYKNIRTAARVAAAVALLAGVGLLALGAQTLLAKVMFGATSGWLLLLLVEIVFAGCAFCSWWWVRPIARRAGRSSLAKLCGYLLFLPVLPFLKAAPFFGLWIFYLVSPLLHFLPLVYIPLSIYLFARCAWLLKQAAPHAEAEWAAETKAPAAPLQSA
jgi:hypothetical protein